MGNQDFTARNFSYLIRRQDYAEYFKAAADKDSEAVKNEILGKIADKLDIENYEFLPLRQFPLNGKTVYSFPKITQSGGNFLRIVRDDFVLRKINHNLQRIYNLKQADRFQIVSCVRTLMESSAPFYVYKLDIKSFYENINRDKILENIKNSAIVSYQTRKLLEKFFLNLELPSGLPRGINISATLSEYCLKSFDKNVRRISSIFYYARFVDDVIIFSIDENTDELFKTLKAYLPEGLSFNESKKKFYSSKAGGISFSYLGYGFERIRENEKKGKVSLKVHIAQSKRAKIKSRLAAAFLAHKNDRDFELLKKRLLFLTAAYPLKTQHKKLSNIDREGALHGGLFYSYPLINDFSCLQELDKFLRGLLFAPWGRARITSALSEDERQELKKISFEQAYKRHIFRKFNITQTEKITRCWR